MKAPFIKSTDESTLRKRIAVLQNYRRLGLTTIADADKYEADYVKRVNLFSFVWYVQIF